MKRESDESEADLGEMEVDVESVDKSVSKNFIVVSGIKETPNSPVGHFSFHPHLTCSGTVDTSIQTYASEIEVFVKCAMLQHGEIIKDKDEFEGIRYVNNPDGLRVVRSLTERKRRTFLGQMFTNLKTEVFTDLVDKELYFSKQTILTKAYATVEELVKQNEEFTAMKARLQDRSRELRTRLNHLVFGETAKPYQVVDTEKLGSVLKHLDIEVEEPLEHLTELSVSSHMVQAPPKSVTTQMTQTAQTPSAVCHDEERGYYALVKTTMMASTISTATASKPRATTALNLATSTTSSQSVVPPVKAKYVPCQVSNPSSKIVCNLSRVNTQRGIGNTSNFCLVTNVKPAMKSLERKNVMHIKIANDVLKHIDEANTLSPEQQAKATPKPKNPTSVSVSYKPQVMLGTLIAKKVVPTTEVIQPPANLEPVTTQVRAQQTSGRLLPYQN